MAAKKGKALARDLIDELLNEDSEKFELGADVTPPKDLEVVSGANVSDPDPLLEFSAAEIENEDTIDINKTEVSGGAEFSVKALERRSSKAVMPNDQARTHHDDDKTERLPQEVPPGEVGGSNDGQDRVRASVGRFGAFRSSGPATATEAALAQSESLRIAQQRLLDFEQEIERLRLQNEELAAAGETLRRRGDEMQAKTQRRDKDYDHAVETFEQEKHLLNATKEALQRDVDDLKRKNEELELRVTTNIQKIRVRERELENRLELVKMESAALIRSKDEMILELKRGADQLNLELNNYRNKNQELNRLTSDKQEMLRRTVKALRLALSMLEGEEETAAPSPAKPTKKAK